MAQQPLEMILVRLHDEVRDDLTRQ